MKSKQKINKTSEEIQADLEAELGEGPMRFGPVHVERTMREELLSNPHGAKGLNVYASLSVHWTQCSESKKRQFTDAQMYRMLRFCKFNQEKALSLMKRTDPRRFQLNAFDLADQLETKTLFPLPGLKTMSGSNCFYMRPCRYDPKRTPTSIIIDNLAYVMESYAHRDVEHKTGIAFIANMNNWTFDNFATDYCFQFMQTLQGRYFPAKVNLFLIVNPPPWFGKIWNIMKGMLSTKFQQKVHMIPEDELPYFFKLGFEKYLPNEFIEGQADVDDIVEDFIKYQQAMEKATGKGPTKSSKEKGGLSRLKSLVGAGSGKREIRVPQLFGARRMSAPKDVYGLSDDHRAVPVFVNVEAQDSTEDSRSVQHSLGLESFES